MAFYKNADYILFAEVLIVSFLTLPLVSTENIDCKGKAFHCVNSTHFKICVDFGGGVSKTVDEFLIPCPTNTVCRDINKFECEHQVTTTLAPISPSDVTNEQAELSETSVWNKVDITTLFPKHKLHKVEELKYDSSVTTTELSSSVVFNDTTDNISSTTLDGRLNQVNLSSDNNVQNTEKSDLSESATVSYVPSSSFDLVTNNDEFITTTAKVMVKDTLLNISLHTNTTNSRDDLSSATTVPIFEGVTERNIGLVKTINNSYENVNNNNQYNNTYNTLSTLVTQTNSLFTPREIFENTFPYSAETLVVSKDPTNYTSALTTSTIVSNNLNIENYGNDSSISLVNSATTTDSYSIDKEHTIETTSSSILNSTYISESLLSGSLDTFNTGKLNYTVGSTFHFMNNVTAPANTQVYTPSKSSTNAFNIDNKTHINHDTNRTETLFTLSYTITEFPSTTSVNETFDNINENVIIESSTAHYSVDNLITPTTDNENRQIFEKNVTSKIGSTDLYLVNAHQLNDFTDISPISDKPFVVNSTESNPTTTYAGLVSEYLFNSTIITNQSITNDLLIYNTSSDRLSLDPLNFNSTKTNTQKTSNDSDTDFIQNKTTFVIENTSIATTLFVDSNNSTIPTQLNLVSMLNTSVPLFNSNLSNTDSNVMTTLESASLPEIYQSITTVNPESYRNQENRYSLSTSQTSDVKETETVSTTTIYSSRDVSKNKDGKSNDFSYVANENKSLENITNNELSGISNKNYDHLNMLSSPVTASTETMSIYLFTMQILKESNKTYFNKTMFRSSNITNKNNILYTVQDPVQTPANQPIIENLLPTTQINEKNNDFYVPLKDLNNIIISNSFTNENIITKTTLPMLKHTNKLATLKSYENKTKMDIKTNEIITTTESVTSDVNSNLLLMGHVETTKTYSETHTQNVLDTTNIFHTENVTHSNIESNILSINYNTSKNMSRVHDFYIDNKEAMLESDVITRSSSFSMKITEVPLENVFEAKTLDLASNSKKNPQTTLSLRISDKNSTDILSTKSNYVSVNDKSIVTTITNNNVILNNFSNDNDFLILLNKPTSTFKFSQKFKSPINDSALKYNNTLELNLTNISNETLIKVLETNMSQKAYSSNYDNTFKKDRLQDKHYKNNINKEHLRIPTDTEGIFSTEVIPKATHLSNQARLLTEQFTCHNRGKYSDKNNCNKFYICIGIIQPIIGMCPAGTVFSEINKQCTKNLSHCIRNNQFRCLSSGRFIDVLSGEFYYVCVKKLDGYVRFKLQCQKGYHLNKENIQCSSDTTSTENVSKTFSDKSTNEKKSKEIKHSQKYEVQFDCEKEGKFVHPNDCRKYFVCTKSSKSKFRRKIKKCDSDEVFNKDKRKCVDSESYEC